MKTLREKILDLHSQGLSYNQIRQQLNCSKGTISYHLNPEVRQATAQANKMRRAERLAKLNALKESKPCVDCNKYFEGYLMDFDHLPEYTKTKNVSYLIDSRGWEKVLEEIAKCDLVCCMCHRKRSRQRWLDNPLRNG